MDLKESGWMWAGFMWRTVRFKGCLSINQVVIHQGSKTVVNLTRQELPATEAGFYSMDLQIVEKLAIDLRLIFPNKDTCESTIQRTFPVFSSLLVPVSSSVSLS